MIIDIDEDTVKDSKNLKDVIHSTRRQVQNLVFLLQSPGRPLFGAAFLENRREHLSERRRQYLGAAPIILPLGVARVLLPRQYLVVLWYCGEVGVLVEHKVEKLEVQSCGYGLSDDVTEAEFWLGHDEADVAEDGVVVGVVVLLREKYMI